MKGLATTPAMTSVGKPLAHVDVHDSGEARHFTAGTCSPP